ncbi:MAG: WYL domain-containing protein [Clostridia bacterium]|nr:WYL domain-containing protein [Clostridia bacterium]
MLFHEIYGSYYQAAASILSEAVRGELTGKKLNALVEKYAFGESFLTIPDGLKGERWRLLHRDLSAPLEAEPEMPVTMLEKRWMKAMLLDPRMQLFEPDMKGLEDVKPLFTPDMVVYYDRYTHGDDYTDPDYIRHFRLILKALREEQNLYVDFESGLHLPVRMAVKPCFLEYSEKDDRFRLIAAGRKRRVVINLSRIKACKLAYRNEPFLLKREAVDSVTFELEDRRNALERVLLHFSHLEKETIRLDEGTYRVTLRYDRRDETEMVIRLLSFGPVVRVTEPDHFIGLLRKRIQKQAALLTPEKPECCKCPAQGLTGNEAEAL